MQKVLYISCEPKEEVFISIFNFLENYINNDFFSQNNSYEFYKTFFAVNSSENKHMLINNIKHNRFQEIPVVSSKEATIMIDVIIPDDDSKIDTFFYRYLFVLKNQLLREQDVIVFSCNYLYYNKISSFVLFENIFSDYMLAYDTSELKTKRFPAKYAVSSEWFPAMSFSKNEKNKLYDILSLPLYSSKEQFIQIAEEYKENTPDLNIVFQYSKYEGIEHTIKAYFTASVLYWLQEIDRKTLNFISQFAPSVSTLSILILAIQLKFINKKHKTTFSIEDIEKIINISSDFSEGILQIIENMISHSKGGCFLLRLNNNLEKINSEYTYNKTDLNIESYLRVSLVDYSKKGIPKSIKEKSGINSNISLEEVFNFDKLDNKEYEEYLLNDDSTVHHYGLPVFKSIVLQYKGCFIVKSSDISVLTNNDISTNFTKDGLIPKPLSKKTKEHISGTEYDIIIPLTKTLYSTKSAEGITSIPFGLDYCATNDKASIIFKNNIYDFFTNQVNMIIKKNSHKFNSMQDLKEKTINEAAEILSGLIRTITEINPVFYFYVDNDILQYRRTEIIAKIILKTFSLLHGENKPLNFLIFGLSDQRLYSFVRQFSLFYRKGNCRYMKNNQLYVVSNSYKTEVLLYGQHLNTSYKHLCSQRFNYGIPTNIVSLISHINKKTQDNYVDEPEEIILPVNYNILNRLDIVNGTPILSKKKWFFEKLYTVINNDIHDKYLGCKISNTHVRVNNIHIDSFYECQLLFGNSFWCDIFANCILEYITSSSLDKNSPIVLFGYETYSEPLLYLLKQKLSSVVQVQVEYVIFENSKYITTNEKSSDKIRYLDSVKVKLKESIQHANFVFISGISTTLSTFKKRMYKQLCCELKDYKLNYDNNFAYVVIQVDDNSKDNTISKEYIEISNGYIYSKKDYLDFVKEEKCGYLITVNAKWQSPLNCSLCTPEDPKKERILIETNESSTVPMILIKPSYTEKLGYGIKGGLGQKNTFLNNIDNKKYLYYCHLNRNGNHHQYYIRTANFVRDNLNENSELCEWLKRIRASEERGFSENTINIIVCPIHFSNETFVSVVNQYVFDNQAHIINLNAKKEFRDSFEAKFSNYKTMFELIRNEMSDISFNINFYYVDDHIVSGATFQRAKSLITGLVSNYLFDNKTNHFNINIFKAMIILVNRNSPQSISSFFSDFSDYKYEKEDAVLPFYSFINLKTPSIRSYGDSCPICQRVKKLEKITMESSLYSTEKYWMSKLLNDKVKNLQEAKAQKETLDDYNRSFDSRGFRRLQCSEIVWDKLNHRYETISEAKIKLEKCIFDFIRSKKNTAEKVEYLISFLKIMCRPHIIYQENINSAILQLVLELYFLYFSDLVEPKDKNLYNYIQKLINSCSNDLKYDFFRAIISSLCTLGSNLFFRDDENFLLDCYEKGTELEKNINNNSYDTSFSEFLRFQIKNNMFANKDSAVKAEKMGKILKRKMEELDK